MSQQNYYRGYILQFTGACLFHTKNDLKSFAIVSFIRGKVSQQRSSTPIIDQKVLLGLVQSKMDLDPCWWVENPSGQEAQEKALSTSLYVPMGHISHVLLLYGLLKYPLTHPKILRNYKFLVQ